jgi:ribosomal protein S18 acetylase RimI-like enzyme
MFGEAMKKVIFRECTYRDIDSIFELDKLWDEEGVAYFFTYGSREDFIADFERFQKYFLVAESEGQIVGYINGSVLVNEKVKVLPKQETYLEIENIYVRPEFRNRHVGGDLLEQLLAIAEQNGIARFVVSTITKDMDRIMRFYQRYGFKPWFVELFN